MPSLRKLLNGVNWVIWRTEVQSEMLLFRRFLSTHNTCQCLKVYLE